jgi:hypothetical protein
MEGHDSMLGAMRFKIERFPAKAEPGVGLPVSTRHRLSLFLAFRETRQEKRCKDSVFLGLAGGSESA